MKFGVGQPVTRKEDDALVRGAGHYVADYSPAGLLHAVVLRSPHAHARFQISDTARASQSVGEIRSRQPRFAKENFDRNMALVDALQEHGILHLDMPATPSRVWHALQQASAAA